MLLLQLLLTLYVFQIKMRWHKSCSLIPMFLSFLANSCFLWWETYIYNHYHCPLWEHFIKMMQHTKWFNLIQMYILVLNAYYHNDNYIRFYHNTLYTYVFCKGHEQLFIVVNSYQTPARWLYELKWKSTK